MKLRWFLKKVTSSAHHKALLGRNEGGMPASYKAAGVLAGGGAFYFLCVFFFSFTSPSTLTLPPLTPAAPWEETFLSRTEDLHYSLSSRATRFERLLFTYAATAARSAVHESALSQRSASDALDASLFTRLWNSVLLGVLHSLYIVLWWGRFWLFMAAGVCVWQYLQFQPYTGDDILGMFTNGRMYHSGIRAGLGRTNEAGITELQVRSFVTLGEVSQKELEESALGKILIERDVANETNKSLARLLLKDPLFPAFVPERGVTESNVSSDRVDRGIVPSLISAVTTTLDQVLASHRRVVNPLVGVNEEITDSLGIALEQVLTDQLKREMRDLSKELVTTAILALFAGRLLSYQREAGMWTLKSNFPHLNARAVVHSVAAYAKEYSVVQREIIRRALMYSQRQGVFTTIQLPVKNVPGTMALRQWTELLRARPEQLGQVAREVELFGLLFEVNGEWTTHVALGIAKNDVSFVNGTYTTAEDVLFVPFYNMMALCNRYLAESKLSRIAVLVEKIEKDNPDSVPSRKSHLISALRLLSPDVVEKVSKEQSIAEGDLVVWAALRCVLHYFGWLALSVGNRQINQASIASCSLKAVDAFSLSDELVFVRAERMIPLRGGRLHEIVKDKWKAHIAEAASVVMVGGAEEAPAVELDDETVSSSESDRYVHISAA